MTWTDFHGKALAKVFAALDESGIGWLVLRNHQGLPWQNSSKDIDLGVDLSSLREAESIVESVLAAEGLDRKETEVFQWGRCTSYYGIVDNQAVSMKIDLMDGFFFRGAHIFAVADLLANAASVDGLRIPNATDDGIMLWIKPLMTGGRVNLKYVGTIEESVRNDPEGFRRGLTRLLPTKLATVAWDRISGGEIESTAGQQRRIRCEVWRKSLLSNPASTLWQALRHVWTEIVRRTFRKRASFVSVAGPDGVGKTTFIDLLTQGIADLKGNDHDKMIGLHFRPRILPNINQLLTGKTETVEEFHNPHRAAPANGPSSLLRITYYWTDYLFGYWVRLRRLCARNRTVIFDRYFYDFIVDPRRSRLSLPGWVPRLFLALTPKPDLVFLLDADAELIYARKQELKPKEIDRQLSLYRTLAARDPKRFVRLDARQLPEEIVRDALRALVERSYNRTHR